MGLRLAVHPDAGHRGVAEISTAMRHQDAAHRSDEFDRPQRASCLEARPDELGPAEKAEQEVVVRLAERLPGAVQSAQLQVEQRQQAARRLVHLAAPASRPARPDESEPRASGPRVPELPALDVQPKRRPLQQAAQLLDVAEQQPAPVLQVRRPAQLAAAMGLRAVDLRARPKAALAQAAQPLVSRRAHLPAGQRDAQMAWPWQPSSQLPQQLPCRRAHENACERAPPYRARASLSASSSR